MINVERRKYTIKFITDMLGTAPKSKDIFSDYIGTLAPTPELAAEEVADVQAIEDRGTTGFLSDENGLYIPDYMIRGNIKNAVQVLIETEVIKKITAYKKWLDELCLVYPRKIYFGKKEPDSVLSRSLRVQTPQGPRVCLAKSEVIAAGSELTFEIAMVPNKKLTFEIIEEALEYGQYVGLGQWRGSGGYGRYVVKK